MQAKELEIKSHFSQLFKVEKFVEEICDHYNINNTYFGNIITVLTEAVSNAIIHGNKEDAGKKVLISFQAVPSGLSFSITDQGDGFDYSSVPDPTDLNIAFKEDTGTGIYLMKKLSDKFIFEKNGRKVRVEFDIASINFELSVQRKKALMNYFHVHQFADNQD